MSDFKAKMQQIRFPKGLHPAPRPCWRSLQPQKLPITLAVFKGPTCKGREGMRSRVPPPLQCYFDHCVLPVCVCIPTNCFQKLIRARVLAISAFELTTVMYVQIQPYICRFVNSPCIETHRPMCQTSRFPDDCG